jgi:hypothetical protein
MRSSGAIAAQASGRREVSTMKFDGDLDKLLIWWRQNKIVQHQRLALVGQL